MVDKEARMAKSKRQAAQDWKPEKGLVQRLVDIVGKEGNYLLNVGLTA